MKSFDISLWEKLQEEELAGREGRRKKTLNDITTCLKRYFSSKKVARVFIIGSILRVGAFYDFSDIDIAVEGLDEDYFLTLSELEAMLERDVDLIELEDYRLKEEVEKRGMRIK
jgi:predicted nucleotidyltransferase